MGWFWARDSPSPTTTPTTPTTSTTSTTPTTTPPSDPMAQFLNHLAAAEATAEASATAAHAQAHAHANAHSTTNSEPPSTTPIAPPTSPAETQYPSTMSCKQAFDLAIGCQSIAGQSRNVYRYGELRVCSEQWQDFWFCMRHKGTSGPVSERMIVQHYRDKEHRKYHAPGRQSSEQIWQSRQWSLPAGAFFNEPIEAPTESDDEWRKKELERRRVIRDEMGYNQPDGTTTK